MSKSLEEVVVVGVIALIVLSFLNSGATAAAASAYQNSTLGQVSGFTSDGISIGEFVETL